ncbi:hypothetical protein JXA80_06365 [bacterium]|nr:hypothetical protein [candidate division CSSED10-310 bacterium]
MSQSDNQPHAEIDLIRRIANQDMEAGRVLTERYAAPLFRFCRLNFNDHFRAGEFIEESLAQWLGAVARNDIHPESIKDLFSTLIEGCVSSAPIPRGKGLSGKQKRILELLELLPVIPRIALDLVWLENHPASDVARWLAIDKSSIERTARDFVSILVADERIKEFLDYAAIQQTRTQFSREKAEERERCGAEDRRSPPADHRPAGTCPRRFSEEPPAGSDPRSRTARDSNLGGQAAKRPDGADAEHPEPRPRRRRVDPRKLNIEL